MDLSGMTVAEIKQLLKSLDANSGAPGEELLAAMLTDTRTGVRNLCRMLEKKHLLLLKEEERLEGLNFYEERFWNSGNQALAGVDEAGRGPLAGPVVAASVILLPGVRIYNLNDSKMLTPVKRKALAAQIKTMSRAWAIGVSTVNEILQLNIYKASMLAMRRSLEGLRIMPKHVLVDGFAIPCLEWPQTGIIGGDRKSASIAAASILAKETRDELMELYHFMYPQYGFNHHKGYATTEHISALRRYGPCPIHRQGFGPVREVSGRGSADGQ